jgi:transcriptional regulator with XRE-family HTH domain
MASGETAPSAALRFGDGVRAQRQRRGLTQDALAKLAGVSRVTVIAIESGTGNATIATLDAIAKALKVDVRELFDPPG